MKKGFTLIELIFSIALIGILASVTVNVFSGSRDTQRFEQTRSQLDGLRIAILGDRGSDGAGRVNFGYAGDWGSLPSSIAPLTTSQNPQWTYDSVYGFGSGWKGPYIDPAFSQVNAGMDAWGNPLVIDSMANPATWISYGADGVVGGSGNDTDLVLQISPEEWRATVYGNVFDKSGNPINGGTVEIRYPVNGVLAAFTTLTSATGGYSFSNVPMGVRAITVTDPLPAVGPRLIKVDQSQFVVPPTFLAPTNVSTAILEYDASKYNGVSFPATGCAITTWTDLSTSGFNGTLTGFGACPADGWRGNGTVANPYAMVLDGTNDYIANINLPPANLSDWSETAWVKAANNHAGVVITNRDLVADHSNSLHIGWWAGAATNNGRAYFSMDGPNCEWGAISTTNIADGNWHFIVGTRASGPGTYRIYVDGVLEGTNNISIGGACSGTSSDGLAKWSIGWSGAWGVWFNGSIAYLSVYNRVLSATEISTLCQTRQGLFKATPICN